MPGFDPVGGAPIGGDGGESAPSIALGGSSCLQQNSSSPGLLDILPLVFLAGNDCLQINLSSSSAVIVNGIINMDYTEITGLARDYSDRKNDPEVLAAVDSFLRIIEAKINRRLAVQKAIDTKNIKLYANQAFYDLPLDCLSIADLYFKSLIDDKKRVTLEYRPPAKLNDHTREGDKREFYTIIGNRIRISPIPNEDFAAQFTLGVDFYLRVAPLTRENPSNYISVFNIDCYLFGMMAEINAFVKDAEAFILWDNRFNTVIDEIDVQNVKVKTGGGPQVMRLG